VVGSSEHGNDPSGSTKVGNFLTSCVTLTFSRKVLSMEL
jgi:hypothetical protein